MKFEELPADSPLNRMEAWAFEHAQCAHCSRSPQQVVAFERGYQNHQEKRNEKPARKGISDDNEEIYEWHDWWEHKERCLREKRLRLKEEIQLPEDTFSLFLNDGYCVDESMFSHSISSAVNTSLSPPPQTVTPITDYLFLGDSSGAKNVKLLQNYSIKTVLNMAEEVRIEDSFYKGLGIKRVWLRAVDAPSYNIATLLQECLAVVSLAKSKLIHNHTQTQHTTIQAATPTTNEGGSENGEEGSGPILVHCAAGVSRSATVVLAALMQLERMTLKQAFLMVKARRSIVYPNKGFLATLLTLEKDLFGTNSIPPAALELHEDSDELRI